MSNLLRFQYIFRLFIACIAICQCTLDAEPAFAKLQVNLDNRFWFVEDSTGAPVFLQGISDDAAAILWTRDDILNVKAMLDDLAEAGGNYVRVNAAAMGKCIFALSDELSAWKIDARSGKLDLARFNEKYFDESLIPFIVYTQKKGIYVELKLFDANYAGDDGWINSVWNPVNNINLIKINKEDLFSDISFSGEAGKLIALQKRYVDKVIEKTIRFDNVIYELVNEKPYPGDRKVSKVWVSEMVNYLRDRVKGKLISINRFRPSMTYTDFPAEDAPIASCGIVIGHIGQGTRAAVPGFRNLILSYSGRKPVSINENYWVADKSFEQNNETAYDCVRHMMWATFTAGAHHNYYTWSNWRLGDKDPEHRKPPIKLIDNLRYLIDFIKKGNIPFWQMAPHDELLKTKPSQWGFVLAYPREYFVVYLMDEGVVESGYIELDGMPEKYHYRWYDPKAGTYYDEFKQGTSSVIELPEAGFIQDIALQISVQKKAGRPTTRAPYPGPS